MNVRVRIWFHLKQWIRKHQEDPDRKVRMEELRENFSYLITEKKILKNETQQQVRHTGSYFYLILVPTEILL